MFHIALRQDSPNIADRLEAFFPPARLSLHYFQTYAELQRISQRFLIDVILISGKGEFQQEIELAHRIKDNVFTSIIPTALYHKSPSDATVISAYESG
ncbi:MAG: hypothetical protein ACE5GA_00495, partial [Candidatus Zixiibacteriota bacterium]